MKLTHPKTYAAIGLTVVLALATLGILRFGNPQWHKYVYIFQCYYWPKHVFKPGVLNSSGDPYKYEISPPENYSGMWKSWHKNGHLESSGNYILGGKNGQWGYWLVNSQKFMSGNYLKGVREGTWKYWHNDEQNLCIGIFKNGEPEDMWIYWNEKGEKEKVVIFKNGKELSTKKFTIP